MNYADMLTHLADQYFDTYSSFTLRAFAIFSDTGNYTFENSPAHGYIPTQSRIREIQGMLKVHKLLIILAQSWKFTENILVFNVGCTGCGTQHSERRSVLIYTPD